MRKRVVAARVARLATTDPAGQPHLVPISFALAGDVVYSAVDSKPKRTRRLQRLANLEREPRATLLVDHYEEDWTRVWWCMLLGRGRVVSEGVEFERAVDALLDKYTQYEGNPPAGPAVVIEIHEWRGWFST
ncbi:MAG: TIGR03668 family PPOX class F420-dependent oxidoreductase [Actinomycetota bacterium]